MQRMMEWAEQGRMPDMLVRAGVRLLLAERLAEVSGSVEETMERRYALIESMRAAPVALSTDIANEQHYEIPTAYFEQCLGPRLKYSSAWWPEGVDTLEAAEVAMLRLTCERAGIADGQRVLELGCGWGSLSLWMAEQYPGARITAVSNSNTQRAFIEARRDALGLANLEILTADMNTFAPPSPGFDRAISIEMFEHMRNWPELLRRIAGWLNPGGRFFMHVFAHREHAYVFESEDEHDWMGRHFFRDGLMPSDDLARHFQEDLRVIRQWRVGGQHYARTLNAWLARQDRARATLMPLFETAYGAQQAALWFQRWRIFYMACAELFDYSGGDEWFVSHVLFERPGD